MSENYFDPYRSRTCTKCRKNVGVHEINFGVWMCAYCYRQYRSDQDAPHTNWSTRETIDSLTEAVYYLNYLHKDKPYVGNQIYRTIRGNQGTVCYVVAQDYHVIDPLGLSWDRRFWYFVLYNRNYLNNPTNLFERASMYKGMWQTVRKSVLLDAVQQYNTSSTNGDKRCSCIAIVMKSKAVWYINPALMLKFSEEYETERIPYNETAPECSIPLAKENIISRYDPFPSIPTSAL